MFKRARSVWTPLVLLLLIASGGGAQVDIWQLGGSGLAWDKQDSLNILVDFDAAPGAIRPIYLEPDINVFSLLDNWQFWRNPDERTLGWVEGQMPRLWKNWSGVGGDPTQSGVFMIDKDSSTYNAPMSEPVRSQFYTFDTAVPIPAVQFGFFTPPRGFRSDGTPLDADAVPAFDVSIGSDAEPAVLWGGNDLFEQVVANVAENYDPTVHIDFPRQYARFFRWRRQLSLVDEEAYDICRDCGGQGNQARALKGSVGGYEVFAHGIPQRVVYLSKIVDLGQVVNFGRLHWSATPMRLRDGAPVEDSEAEVWVMAELRTGRDDDPATYHEFTNISREKVVSRERYEELSPQLNREAKPGMRASVGYDSENWSFWSVPFTAPGQRLSIRSGSHLQLTLTLESRDFDAWVRIDSLWIETAPLLADEVFGEVARLDDPQSARGFTEVQLGEPTDFIYEVQASFEGTGQPGFDVLRIRTGSQTHFRHLEMGAPLAAVEPVQLREEEDGLTIQLPEKITRTRNPPIRITFSTEVFQFAATFAGEISSSDTEGLPQPIVAGNASEAVSTNSLRVLSAAGKSPDFVQGLALSTPVLTPNGDGIHDRLSISYSLFRLPGPVPVTLEVYALDGRRIARLDRGLQDSGSQKLDWDGRDARGELLEPGLYLVSVSLQTQFSQSRQVRALGIAY